MIVESPIAPAKVSSFRMVSRAMHAADDRRLAVVVLASSALVQLLPAVTPIVLGMVMLGLWNALERNVSIFNSSLVLQRQQATRMRLDFMAGLFVVSALLVAIARTAYLLVAEEDATGPKTVLVFCVLGAAMCWTVFNHGWEFVKLSIGLVVVLLSSIVALTLEQSPLPQDSGLALWVSNLFRILLLSIACHAITWRTLRGVRYSEAFGLPINLARTVSFAVLLTLAVERPGTLLKRPETERWIWLTATIILFATMVAELIRVRADLRKEGRAFWQIASGVTVPPRRRRLGIWTQLAFIPASVTIGLAPWLEWSYCLVAGILASLLAAPHSQRQRSASAPAIPANLPATEPSLPLA